MAGGQPRASSLLQVALCTLITLATDFLHVPPEPETSRFSLSSELQTCCMATRGARKQGRAGCPPAEAQLGQAIPAATTATARPARQRRAPTRYQGPGVGDDEGEVFDLNNVSGDSDESDSAPSPQALAARRGPPRGADTETSLATNTARTDPLATSQSETRGRTQNIAFDIRHFFRKEDERTVCLPCE